MPLRKILFCFLILGIPELTPLLSAQSHSHVVGSGTGQYSSMAACYSALPSTGGVCEVSEGWSDPTWTADLTLSTSKPNSGFVFDGTATINMGTHSITAPGGVQGFFLIGLSYGQLSAGNGSIAAPVRFIYTGSGYAIYLGDSTSTTFGLQIDNIMVDITGAGSSAICLRIINNVSWQSRGFVCQGQANTTNVQEGVILDGAGSNTTAGNASNMYVAGVNIALAFTGTGVNTANFNRIDGSFIPMGQAPVALYFAGGNGNTVMANTGNESGTLVHMTALSSNTLNNITVYNCGETSTAKFLTGTSRNLVTAISCSPTGVVDQGTGNHATLFTP